MTRRLGMEIIYVKGKGTNLQQAAIIDVSSNHKAIQFAFGVHNYIGTTHLLHNLRIITGSAT